MAAAARSVHRAVPHVHHDEHGDERHAQDGDENRRIHAQADVERTAILTGLRHSTCNVA